MYSAAYLALGGDPNRMITMAGALSVIRDGIPIAMFDRATEAVGSKKEIFANLIGANLRTLQRKKAGRLTPMQSEHLLAIIAVYASAAEYFDNADQAREWVHLPQIIFGNKPAFSYLDTMAGVRYVGDIINIMKCGMTA